METPHHGKGNLIVYGICEFLQEVHPQLLQHCRSPQFAHQKERTLELDLPSTERV